MNVTLIPADKSSLKQIKELYIKAFPADERAPFWLLRRKACRGKAEMLTANENGKFIGFVYIVTHKDLAYLFYLAVSSNERGKGYGTAILDRIKEHYKGKRIFLAREELDKTFDNYDKRLKRCKFYQKNGFENLPLKIKEASVTYDVMGIGGSINPGEYALLIKNWLGKLFFSIIPMKMFSEN